MGCFWVPGTVYLIIGLLQTSAMDNGNSHRMMGSEVGQDLVLYNYAWMRNQWLGSFFMGWVRNRGDPLSMNELFIKGMGISVKG